MKIVVKTDQKQELVRWLADNLFFEKTQSLSAVRNGGCVIEAADCGAEMAEERYYKGFVHIALRTYDISRALEYCRSRGLSLELDGGRPFFNPGIYGEGEYFFNVVSPFGIRFEVSERAADREGGGADCEGGAADCEGGAAHESGAAPESRAVPVSGLLCGLDHMGLQVNDIQAAVSYYRSEGFQPEFHMVANETEADGRVFAVMMRKGGIIVELFELADRPDEAADPGRIFVERE